MQTLGALEHIVRGFPLTAGTRCLLQVICVCCKYLLFYKEEIIFRVAYFQKCLKKNHRREDKPKMNTQTSECFTENDYLL